MVIMLSMIIISPTTQNRKRRCKSATLLTASPHKNLLLSQKAKKRPQDKKKITKKSTTKSLPKRKTKSKEEDWTCMVCFENTREAMTRCLSCNQWAHDKCTSRAKLTHFVCDVCKELQPPIHYFIINQSL